VNNELERMCMEAVVALFKVQSQHLPGGTEEIQEKTQPLSGLRFEPPEYEAGVLTTRPRRTVIWC
jgi:hypothetical protein